MTNKKNSIKTQNVCVTKKKRKITEQSQKNKKTTWGKYFTIYFINTELLSLI